MVTTSPSNGPEDDKFILARLLEDIFGNQLVIGDIHAPMNKLSDIYKITQNDDIIGGWSVFHGFDTPVIAFPTNPIGWEVIKEFLETTPNQEFMIPFPNILEEDHGKRPWDDWEHYHLEREHTDIAMRITTKDFEIPDVSDLPNIRAANMDDLDALKQFYNDLDDEFEGFFHPVQLESDNYVVCVEEGEIIATAGTHFETPYTVQLGNIFVKEEYRRRGIGRAVTIAVTLGAIKSKRVPTLFVNKTNKSAISLYEDIGFDKYNEYEFWKATSF